MSMLKTKYIHENGAYLLNSERKTLKLHMWANFYGEKFPMQNLNAKKLELSNKIIKLKS